MTLKEFNCLVPGNLLSFGYIDARLHIDLLYAMGLGYFDVVPVNDSVLLVTNVHKSYKINVKGFTEANVSEINLHFMKNGKAYCGIINRSNERLLKSLIVMHDRL